ncbi:MAG: hypothetical protein V2A55_00130 [Candidatus Jorgensenbacteria bacterium]
MNRETKICQNCKNQFVIEPEDFGFYEKFKVPVPKMCPLCRAQRRLAFRDERVFYKRKCDKCGKDTVSMYSPNKPYAIWCYDCWFSDDWDARDYGRDYDPNRSFFEQFEDLWKAVPKVGLIYVNSPGSEYTNISADNKNCYMIVESSNNENCIHSYWIQQCKDLVDVSFSHQTELSYESDDCYNSYKLFWSKGCHDSRDSYFLLDCRNCSNCVGCVNLRNKQYHIFNKPVSKKEYDDFVKEVRLDSWSGVEAMRRKFADFLKTQPRKYAEIVNAPDSTGNYIKDAKNCRNVFHCYDAEDSKYGVHVWRNAKDCVDVDTAGRSAARVFNSMNAGIEVSDYICCNLSWSCSFMWYSYYCFNSNNCFGSVGLRKQNYCILNKQYDKESFEKLKDKIIEDMKQRGEYGEFFPASISAFGYNESAAQEQFPLTKNEALKRGFKWEDYPRGTYDKGTVSWDKVPDSIDDIGGMDVSKEIFTCLDCKKNYKVIANEFAFYKKLQIPLPRLCPDCRHLRRFTARGPNRLWNRNCSKCGKSIETSYAPDRPEIIYCEECYNAEIV